MDWNYFATPEEIEAAQRELDAAAAEICNLQRRVSSVKIQSMIWNKRMLDAFNSSDPTKRSLTMSEQDPGLAMQWQHQPNGKEALAQYVGGVDMAAPQSERTETMNVCRGCGKEIVWGVTDDGKKIPLDLRAPVYFIKERPENGNFVIERTMNAGVSHFATCPRANDFSGSKKKSTQG